MQKPGIKVTYADPPNVVTSIYGSSILVKQATNVTYPALWLFTKNSKNGAYKSGVMLDTAGVEKLIDALTEWLIEARL